MPKTEEPLANNETQRLESFSDGVFAIAITLLTLQLKIPQPYNGAQDKFHLTRELLAQWPAYIAFVTSFFTILIMWVNHHRMFNLVRRADLRFMIANGFLLMLVTVVPFPTALVAEFLTKPGGDVACACYAGLFVIINLAYNLLWYSARRRSTMIHVNVGQRTLNKLTRTYLFGLPPYLLATIIAFFSPVLSFLVCTVMWIYWIVVAKEIEHDLPGQN